MGAPLSRGAHTLPVYLWEVASNLAAGPLAPGRADVLAVVALGLASGWALVRGRGAGRWRLLTLLAVPVVGSFLLQLRVPFFWPRFLLYATPALYLLAAWGLVRLRWGAAPLVAALGVAWAIAWPTVYRPLVAPEDDLRPLVAPLGRLARAGDGVIVSYIWQEGILRMEAPDLPVTYHLGWFNPQTVDEQMRDLLTQHPRLWLLTYRVPLQHEVNPGGLWLEGHAARALVVENGPQRNVLYLAPCDPREPTQPARFAGGINLAYRPPAAQAAPGDTLSVALRWSAATPPERANKVFVHLYDPAGRLVAQSDSEPVNGLAPLTQLQPGQALVDCRALLVPREATPGRYTVVVGLYDPATGKRLNVVEAPGGQGDHAVLGAVQVGP